jgi:hypothetical protein
VLASLGQKAERKQGLNWLLAGQEAPVEEQEDHISMDGGVRRPMPIHVDPNADLNALIYGLARERPERL